MGTVSAGTIIKVLDTWMDTQEVTVDTIKLVTILACAGVGIPVPVHVDRTHSTIAGLPVVISVTTFPDALSISLVPIVIVVT